MLELVRADLRDTFSPAVLDQEQNVSLPEQVLDGHHQFPGFGSAQLLLTFLVSQLSLLLLVCGSYQPL